MELYLHPIHLHGFYKEKFIVIVHITAPQHESLSALQYTAGNAISYPLTRTEYVQLSSSRKSMSKTNNVFISLEISLVFIAQIVRPLQRLFSNCVLILSSNIPKTFFFLQIHLLPVMLHDKNSVCFPFHAIRAMRSVQLILLP